MKLVLNAAFLLGALFVLAEGLPRPEVQSEILPAHPEKEEPDTYKFEDGAFPSFFDPVRSFNFFRGFDDIFRKLTEQFTGFTSNSSSLGTPTNSTSTKKVIDGHTMTVNETTYEKDNEFLVVKVIEIQPNQEELKPSPNHDVEETKENPHSELLPESEVEEVDTKPEDTNEIPKRQIEDFTSHEFNPEQDDQLDSREYHIPEPYNDNLVGDVDAETVHLDRDIYVNKIIEEKTRGGLYMVPSSVEVFDVKDGKPIESYSAYNPNTFRERTQSITV